MSYIRTYIVTCGINESTQRVWDLLTNIDPSTPRIGMQFAEPVTPETSGNGHIFCLNLINRHPDDVVRALKRVAWERPTEVQVFVRQEDDDEFVEFYNGSREPQLDVRV